MKLLLVEDYESSIPMLTEAIVSAFKKHYPDFSSESITLATTYSSAESVLEAEIYDYVLLDNGIPGFEGARFNKNGYELIPKIRAKSKETKVIGTSNMDRQHLDKLPRPDYVLDKADPIDGLEGILSSIRGDRS